MLKTVLIRRLPQWAAPAVVLVLLCITAAVAATVTLFTASYDGANVRVEWEVSTEVNVTGFDLARKAASEASFTAVTSVVPTGQRRYLFLDANVYRATGGGGTPAASGPFTYRLTVRSSGGDQSYLTVLAGTPSSVQRSWGTIKSMFR